MARELTNTQMTRNLAANLAARQAADAAQDLGAIPSGTKTSGDITGSFGNFAVDASYLYICTVDASAWGRLLFETGY